MSSCGVCESRALHSAAYKVRCDDGAIRAFPGLECDGCGRIQPDTDAIARMKDVPAKLRERCGRPENQVRAEPCAAKAGLGYVYPASPCGYQ
jgi:hypothetical protein